MFGNATWAKWEKVKINISYERHVTYVGTNKEIINN